MINYEFIGWCKEDNHDKIYVIIVQSQPQNTIAVWGRRGKKLQYKIYANLRWFEIDKLIDNKIKKGYNKISPQHLDQVYPNFEQDIQQTYVWALLSA